MFEWLCVYYNSSDGLRVDDIDIYYLHTNASRSDNDIDCEQPRGKYMFISDPTKVCLLHIICLH